VTRICTHILHAKASTAAAECAVTVEEGRAG
jgi:hypothetical protein